MRPGLVLAAMGLLLALPGSVGNAAPPLPKSPKLVTPEIRKAVDRGLDYLARIQQPDGSFPATWDARSYPAAMTSFAGLALMSSGSTPETGPYAKQVKKAMLYLLGLAESHKDGLIAGPRELRSTYGHGYSMLFLAHCYGAEQETKYEKRIKKVLDDAVALVARGQSKHGGWLYSPVGGGDEGSTTACVLQGLRACRNVGIKVPVETIDRAVGYLRKTQNPDGGIAYSMHHRGGSRPALAAAALACFYSAGIYDRKSGGDTPESIMVDKLWRYIKTIEKKPDLIGGFFFYHHFYMAQAQYRRGGKEWEDYYKATARELLKKQAANGTWNGDDVGPTYGTAIACFILQMPYAYMPICER